MHIRTRGRPAGMVLPHRLEQMDISRMDLGEIDILITSRISSRN